MTILPEPKLRIDNHNFFTLVYIDGKLVDGIRKIKFEADGIDKVDLLLDIDLKNFRLRDESFTGLSSEKSSETN